jgi:hypothetical protein
MDIEGLGFYNGDKMGPPPFWIKTTICSSRFIELEEFMWKLRPIIKMYVHQFLHIRLLVPTLIRFKVQGSVSYGKVPLLLVLRVLDNGLQV